MKHLTTQCFSGVFPLLFSNRSVHTVGEPDRVCDFRIAFDVRQRLFHLCVDGDLFITRRFFVQAHSLERITFRTGSIRRFPDADTPTDQNIDVPDPGKTDEEAAFFIKSVRTSMVE